MKKLSYLLVDVEATGSNYGIDLIFEIAAILIENNKIIHEFHSYINIPNKRIYQAKQQLYFIINIDVHKIQNAPSFTNVFSDFMKIVKKHKIDQIKIVAHNVLYDYNIIYFNAKYSCSEDAKLFFNYFNKNQIDTIQIAKMVFPNANRYSLNYIAEYIIQNENNKELKELLLKRKLHNALIDTKILSMIFLNMKQKNPFLF